MANPNALYKLTSLGTRLATNTRNPDKPAYAVLHALKVLGTATMDRISNYTGLSSAQVNIGLNKLLAFQPPLAEVSN